MRLACHRRFERAWRGPRLGGGGGSSTRCGCDAFHHDSKRDQRNGEVILGVFRRWGSKLPLCSKQPSLYTIDMCTLSRGEFHLLFGFTTRFRFRISAARVLGCLQLAASLRCVTTSCAQRGFECFGRRRGLGTLFAGCQQSRYQNDYYTRTTTTAVNQC